jgi:hemerythrin-like domain-containing protein
MTHPIEDPIRHLRAEHDAVLEVIDRMEMAAGDLGGSRRAEALRTLSEGLDFLLKEVRDHMGLEEEVLYPALAKHVPAKTVAVIVAEHSEITWAFELLKRALDTAGPSLRMHANTVVDLVRQHIDKENNVLFMMTAHMLSEDEDQELAAAMHQTLAKNATAIPRSSPAKAQT